MAEEFEGQEAFELESDVDGIEDAENDFEDVSELEVSGIQVDHDDEDDDEEDFEEAVDEEDDKGEEDSDGGVSDEELDQIADTAIAFIEQVLPFMNVGEVTINEYEGDDGELILDLTGDDLAILIGRHGKTLDALQFLVSTATARTLGKRHPVVVDVENYKGRQHEKLEQIALNAAERAYNQNRSVKLRPMTPYERRIVHLTLANDERVETASEGEGSARRVVVLPASE